MNLSSQGIEILVLTYTASEQTEYLQRIIQRLPPTSDRSLARALRNNFPVKPFNPALIRITVCNQTGCECIVCTSNPSLMTGLSCPDIGTYTRTFLDLFFEIFGCARQYEQALFLDIFGCALHSPNKFDSALACTKIALACTKIGCARHSPFRAPLSAR